MDIPHSGTKATESLNLGLTRRAHQVEMSAIAAARLARHLLEAERWAGPVDHDSGIGLWREAKCGQPCDLFLVILAHRVAFKGRGPEASE